MEEVSNFWPPMAVPMTVKMPEPMTAPIPRAVSETEAQGLFQFSLGQLFRVGDQLIDRLAAERKADCPSSEDCLRWCRIGW